MPEQDDGILERPPVTIEENEMAADLSDNCLQLLLDEQFSVDDGITADAKGSALSAFDIVRHSAARKFNQEDPIEAAAVEMILQRNA